MKNEIAKVNTVGLQQFSTTHQDKVVDGDYYTAIARSAMKKDVCVC